MRHHLGTQGIQHHIAAQLKQMRIFLQQNRGELPLEEMPHPFMSTIEGLRIPPIQLSHTEREIRCRRFKQQMIVIVHQTIGMAAPAEAIDHMSGERQKRGSVLVIRGSVLPGITTTRDMIDGTGIFNA